MLTMKINKTTTPEQVSEKLVQFAHDYVAKMSKLQFPYYADSMRIYYKDASDYCKIAALIVERNFKAALKTANGMDTCPRDEIPQDVWDYINHHSKV
jgi:hypothetical protein